MVVPSPRFLFACTIPTIIVILSYIWFKRKKELEESNGKSASKINNEMSEVPCSRFDEEKRPELVSVEPCVTSVSCGHIYASNHKGTSENDEEIVKRDEVPPINCSQEELFEPALMNYTPETLTKAAQDFEFIINDIHESDIVEICSKRDISSEEVSDASSSVEDTMKIVCECHQMATVDKVAGMTTVGIVDTTINNNDDDSFFESKLETQHDEVNILDVEDSNEETVKPEDERKEIHDEVESSLVSNVEEKYGTCLSSDNNTGINVLEEESTVESIAEIHKVEMKITTEENFVGDDEKTFARFSRPLSVDDVVDKEESVEHSFAHHMENCSAKEESHAEKYTLDDISDFETNQVSTINSETDAVERSESNSDGVPVDIDSSPKLESVNESNASGNSANDSEILTITVPDAQQKDSDDEINTKQVTTGRLEDVIDHTSERNSKDVEDDPNSKLIESYVCYVVNTDAQKDEEQLSKSSFSTAQDSSEELVQNPATDIGGEHCNAVNDGSEAATPKCPKGSLEINDIDAVREFVPVEFTMPSDRDYTITDVRSMGELEAHNEVVHSADYATGLRSDVGEGGDGSLSDRQLEDIEQKFTCTAASALKGVEDLTDLSSPPLSTDISNRGCGEGEPELSRNSITAHQPPLNVDDLTGDTHVLSSPQATEETCVIDDLQKRNENVLSEESASMSLRNSDPTDEMCAALDHNNSEINTCSSVEVCSGGAVEKVSDSCLDISGHVDEPQDSSDMSGVEVGKSVGVDCTDSNIEQNTVTVCVDEGGDKITSHTVAIDGTSCDDCTYEELPAFSASGLCTDEPELQKLVNGGSLSAYGSASHSPAEDILESPTASNYSDLQSEGSSDSGKGGSDIHPPSAEGTSNKFLSTPLQVFEFELPQSLCGRLIGQHGRYVNLIKNRSRASISIKSHPINPDLKLCAVIGSEVNISNALVMIRKRFPINKFPSVTLMQVNGPLLSSIPLPDTLQLHLPEGVTCDVMLSSLVNAGDFFVQQPTHPTYPSLSRLDQFMLACYMNGMGAPELPSPVEPGIICAASTMGGWYRAQVVYVYPDSDECDVKFVDYGGYSREAISSLRQIRSDFMTLPFQATECYLASVAPIDENLGWSLEASSYFEELAQGQILQAQIVAYSEDGVPFVHLYRIQGVTTTFINKQLVTSGFAKWVDHQA